MSSGERILVTDGDQRSALAAVRSLGDAGYHVVVSSPAGTSLAGASRHAREDVAVGDPLTDPEAYGEAIHRTVAASRMDVLLPISEATMRAVLTRFEHEPPLIPCGDLDRFLRISDKGRVLEVAAEVGIAVPSQRAVESRDRIEEVVAGDLTFPVVLKPGRSVSADSTGTLVKSSVRYASDREELLETLRGMREGVFPVFLQQRIVGPGVGVFLLLWDGRLVASFAHRRIREKPPSGGVSVYRESIAVDPCVVEKAHALLDRFSWNGVAMVEFKIDAASGTPYLMEINPRFWGSLQLAVDAGVDFPRLLVQTALGEQVRGPEHYATGVRSRWWWGDVDQMILRLHRRDATLDLPPDAPSRAATLWEFLHLWRPGDRNEILRLSDIRPFLRESRLWFRRA